MSDYNDALQRVINESVAPAAREVDELGRFPAESVKALGDAGILGLTSAASVGGAGEGLRAAAGVIESLAVGVRFDRHGDV